MESSSDGLSKRRRRPSHRSLKGGRERSPLRFVEMIFAASQVFFRLGVLDRDLRQMRSALNQLQIPVGALEHLINALTHLRSEQFSNSDGMPLFTRREEDVVRLVTDGLKNREIAVKAPTVSCGLLTPRGFPGQCGDPHGEVKSATCVRKEHDIRTSRFFLKS